MSVQAIDLQQGLTDAWSSVASFIPKLVAFLVILVIGWIVARVLQKVIDVVLGRIGFNRAVERGGLGRALERSKYDASGLVARIIYYAVLLIALQIGFGAFGPNPISDLLGGLVAWLPRVAVAIILVVVAAAIAKAVRDLVEAALGGLAYGRLLAMITQVFIIGLGAIAALNQMGIAITVTMPVLITVLATVGGILVVGMGGGLIRPMQARWEQWLATMQRDTQQVRSQARAGEPYPSEPTTPSPYDQEATRQP
ncbi:MAG: hypothetical protein GEV03_03725 [Streptosporangiales bacterium]|nr:hypothetical protein [Streptosporangiales bacterium]